MPALVLFVVLHGFVSIPPIHVFQPYRGVKCPHGYSVWWPAGKEFDDDRYAECIKPIARTRAKSIVTPAANTERLSSNPHSLKEVKKNPVSPVKLPAAQNLSTRVAPH